MLKKLSLFIFIFLMTILTACKVEPTVTTVGTTSPLNCQTVGFTYDEDNLDYELVWSDEFDGTELDLTKWNIITGGDGFGNNEKQYYTDGDNLEVKDGNLIITAKRENYQNRQYTSSKLTTQNKGDFKYGKIEVKAKLPTGKGTWPAIWMMPKTSKYGGWPNSGEIDIMEHVGYDPAKVHGTVHTANYNHKMGTQKGGGVTVDTFDSEFHTYSIEWLPDKIDFLVDNEVYYTFNVNQTFIQCPTNRHWPFDQSFYLILNIAMGGDWGGSWDRTGDGVDPEFTETQMIIDYVKVYQSEEITNIVKQ